MVMEKGTIANFRFRLPPQLKEAWFSKCEEKRISQQDAINEMLGWFLRQDSFLQSLIFHQLGENDWELATKAILERKARQDGDGPTGTGEVFRKPRASGRR